MEIESIITGAGGGVGKKNSRCETVLSTVNRERRGKIGKRRGKMGREGAK